MSTKLDLEDVQARLPEVAPWKLAGHALHLGVKFHDFAHAMRFVNRVAALAEEANHHPDFHIRWNRVMLELSTHSAGGLTLRDFALAGQILEAARQEGAVVFEA